MSEASTMDGLTILDETTCNAELLAELRAHVLKPSFPVDEYMNDDDDPHEGPLLVACGPDGSVVGGALGEYYDDSTALLGYIAVRPGCRGRGIGQRLMAAITSTWTEDGRRWFIEIDDPRHHGSHAVYGDPRSRVAFYRRFGVVAIPIPYFQPRLAPGLNRGAHMLLGIVPPGSGEAPKTLPGAEVAAFLKHYFMVCEGSSVSVDPDVKWLLGWCRSGEVPMIALDPDHLAGIPDDEPPSAHG